MSLLILTFHRACAGPNGNSPALLDALFDYVGQACHCVLPGEELDDRKMNVCLSFDGGYFDFHHVVMPLLERHELRALLAISPDLCPEACRLDAVTRMGLGGLCTWKELAAIAASKRVAFAAHGLTHVALDNADVDLESEIVRPRQILEDQLQVSVDSFVFPFGRYTLRSLAMVHGHYRHALRGGHVSNASWSAPILYRVDADGLDSPDEIFSPARRRAAAP